MNRKSIDPALLDAANTPGSATGAPKSKKWFAIWILVGSVVGIGAVAGVAFLAHIYFVYGGVSGYRQAHRPFPGANAPQLQSGRAAAEVALQKVSKRLADLQNVGTVFVLPQQRQDLCEKGEHGLPIAGARIDSFAYTCGLTLESIVAYSAPECQVAQVLLANNIPFGTASGDCPQGDDQTQAQINSKLGLGADDSSAVTIDTKEHYLKYFEVGVNSILKCYTPREVAYCKTQNVDDDEVNASLQTIPAGAQTILDYTASATYYADFSE